MQDVLAAVIVREGSVLLAKRKPGGALGGKWEFPGGKLEEGESPEDGLRRELVEELGIEAEIGDFIATTTFNNGPKEYRLLAYFAVHRSGRIRALEHDELRWVNPRDLSSFDLADSDRKLLPQITKRILDE
jgi:8-oxo-dGTP diphosphatase